MGGDNDEEGQGVRQPWSYGIECVVRLYLARAWPPVRLLNLLPAFWTVVAVILLFRWSLDCSPSGHRAAPRLHLIRWQGNATLRWTRISAPSPRESRP
jgi:hypothetical protein